MKEKRRTKKNEENKVPKLTEEKDKPRKKIGVTQSLPNLLTMDNTEKKVTKRGRKANKK